MLHNTKLLRYLFPLGAGVILVALAAVLYLVVLRVQNPKPTIERPRAEDQHICYKCDSPGSDCVPKMVPVSTLCSTLPGYDAEQKAACNAACKALGGGTPPAGGGGGACGQNLEKGAVCTEDCQCISTNCEIGGNPQLPGQGHCTDPDTDNKESRCRSGVDCGDCAWVARFYYYNRDNTSPAAENYYEAACEFAKLGQKCANGCAGAIDINFCDIQTATCGWHRGKPGGGGGAGLPAGACYAPGKPACTCSGASAGNCGQCPAGYTWCYAGSCIKANCGGGGGGGGGGCNAQSPACVWNCFQNGAGNIRKGNCSGCIAYCANPNACIPACVSGETCQNGVCVAPTPPPPSELNTCWGNGGTDGKCYDCNGDGEINILDFSCFSKRWLNNISS